MIDPESPHATTRIDAADATAGFSCGNHALDDFFARHAVANDAAGIGRAYVLRRGSCDEEMLPPILGFYTLSMAHAESSQVAKVLEKRLPKYPMPVALIGRLAVDKRAQGRRVGERLLIDALRRVVRVTNIVGCIGIVVDAKDEGAAHFYAKYGFIDVVGDGRWPQRMFMAIQHAQGVFEP